MKQWSLIGSIQQATQGRYFLQICMTQKKKSCLEMCIVWVCAELLEGLQLLKRVSVEQSKCSLESTVCLEMAVRRIEELVVEIGLRGLLRFCEVT